MIFLVCVAMNDLKYYGSASQALEIIFEVQRKRINGKIRRKKKALQLTKLVVFLFS